MNFFTYNKKQKTGVVFLVLFVTALIFLSFFKPTKVLADTFDICDSGCKFTSIQEAVASSSVVAGSILSVGPTYTKSTDDIYPGPDLTISCQSTSTIIGTPDGSPLTFRIDNSGFTLTNCGVENVTFFDNTTSFINNITFSNNYFSTSSPSFFNASTGKNISNVSFTNNFGGVSFLFGGSITSSVFSGNTFYNMPGVTFAGALMRIGSGSSDLLFTNNTFYNYNTDDFGTKSFQMISLVGTNNTVFSSNTFAFIESTPNAASEAIVEASGENNIFDHNIFDMSRTTYNINTTGGLYGLDFYDEGLYPISATVDHNTFIGWSLPGPTGAILEINESHGAVVTSTNNLFVKSPGNLVLAAVNSENRGSPNSLALFADYNGFAGVDNNFQGPAPTQELHTINTSGVVFKIKDTDPANDFELVPFSAFLNVDGVGGYIGAIGGTRRSTVNINAVGAIDYMPSSVDATSTLDVFPNIRTGDTVNLAAGTYEQVAINSAQATSSITVNGAGNATIISPSTNNIFAFSLHGVSNSVFSNFLLENSTDPVRSYSYLISPQAYSDNGTDYNQGDLLIGAPNSTVLLSRNDFDCLSDLTIIKNTGFNFIPNPLSNISVALVSIFGAKITLLVPSNLASDETALNTLCGSTISVEKWFQSIYTVNGYDLQFNPTLLGDTTLDDGFSTSIVHQNALSGGAGINLVDSSYNTFNTVTSTNNYLGAWLSGNSTNNTFINSVFTNNLGNDILSESSGNTILKNTIFDNTFSNVGGTGNIDVYNKMRAFIKDASNNAVAGVQVAFTDHNHSTTTIMTTDETGFTSYTDYLLSFVMTSSDISTTSGGYNPYIITTNATSTFAASTVNANFITPNQLFTITISPPQEIVPTPIIGGGGVQGGRLWLPTPPTSTVTISTSTPVSRVTVTQVPPNDLQIFVTKPVLFPQGGKTNYQYIYTNTTTKKQNVLVTRTITNKNKKIVSQTKRTVVIDSKKTFSRTIKELIPLKTALEKYTVAISVFDAKSKKILATDSFWYQVTAKNKKK